MALGKINHLQFDVDDLEKTVKYFTGRLGFKLVSPADHPESFVELASPAGDLLFDFHQVTEEYKDSPEYKSSMGTGRPCLNHIAFEVEDIDKEYEELKSKGVPFRRDAPHLETLTGRRLANTYDTDGRRWIQLQEVKPT